MFNTAKKPTDARLIVAVMLTRSLIVVGRFWTERLRARTIACSCDAIVRSPNLAGECVSIGSVETFSWGTRIALRKFRFYRASQVILRQKPSLAMELWQRLVGYARLIGEFGPIVEYWPGF